MGIQISLPMMAFLVLMTGFAGFVDSAAGGGGLISLPAYLFAGLPPHYTYATNKFSAACGRPLRSFTPKVDSDQPGMVS